LRMVWEHRRDRYLRENSRRPQAPHRRQPPRNPSESSSVSSVIDAMAALAAVVR